MTSPGSCQCDLLTCSRLPGAPQGWGSFSWNAWKTNPRKLTWNPQNGGGLENDVPFQTTSKWNAWGFMFISRVSLFACFWQGGFKGAHVRFHGAISPRCWEDSGSRSREKLSPRPKVKCRNRPLLPKILRPRIWLHENHENKNTGCPPTLPQFKMLSVACITPVAKHLLPSYHILCHHHPIFGETPKKHW